MQDVPLKYSYTPGDEQKTHKPCALVLISVFICIHILCLNRSNMPIKVSHFTFLK